VRSFIEPDLFDNNVTLRQYLSDFSKGQAFECFHGYKQAHISLCAYCAYVYSLFLLPFLFFLYIFVCMYFFSFSSFDYHFGE